MNRDAQAGMTMIELVIILGVIAAVIGITAANLADWAADQRASTSARSVADAFSLARVEAIRSGSNHIVAFSVEAGLDGITNDVVVVNDGPAATANCSIDAGEIVHSIALEQGASFGSDPGLANGLPAPNDSGASTHQALGSSFTDPDGTAASWVTYGSDGLPRQFAENTDTAVPCQEIGVVGAAGGGIYLTNGNRDYAVVMTPLGTVRLHRWTGSAWAQ